MTKEEAIKKYPFLTNMTPKEIQELVCFITMGLLDLSFRNNNDDEPKIGVFIQDVKAFFRDKE